MAYAGHTSFSAFAGFSDPMAVRSRMDGNGLAARQPFEPAMQGHASAFSNDQIEVEVAPGFGLKVPASTSYSKVHPKKKMRMTYHKEIARAARAGALPRHPRVLGGRVPPIGHALDPLTGIHGPDEVQSFGECYAFNGPVEGQELRAAPASYQQPFFPSASSSPNSPFDRSCAPSDCGSNRPQDLRLRSSERFSESLRDVARGILTASADPLPQLCYAEIPTIVERIPEKDTPIVTAVGKSGIFDSLDNKRVSRESDAHRAPNAHGEQRMAYESQKCVPPPCSPATNFCDQISTLVSDLKIPEGPSSARSSSKDSAWSEADSESPSRRSDTFTPVTEDPEGYLRKPIENWSYADAIFFLMGACSELDIKPSEVKFKSSDDGSVLSRMSPTDFEVLAPNNGQKLYDYFLNFKMQHYVASKNRLHQDSYFYDNRFGDSFGSDPRHHPSPGAYNHTYPYHHHHPPHSNEQPSPQSSVPSPYEDRLRTSPYPPNGVDSPSNEYIPQGSQYLGVLPANNSTGYSSEPLERKCYETPSAAWKSFPPLHSNFDEEPFSDPEDFEPPPEPPKKRGPGRPPKPENERKRKPKRTGRLWEFIRNMLLDPKTCPSLLRWEDASAGIFRIVQSDAIAVKWGMRKNNEKMTYEKLSRAMRYYYKAKIFEPVIGKRLVYKFGSNAKGWRPVNPNNPNFQKIE